MYKKNYLSFSLYFLLLFSINIYSEDSISISISSEVEISDSSKNVDTLNTEPASEEVVTQESENIINTEDDNIKVLETEVAEEEKDSSLDLTAKPVEFEKNEQVELVKKELRNPHSRGKGFLIPGLILPAVSGACWGVSYFIESKVGDDWISRNERLRINVFQIAGTVMGSAAIPLFTIGVVKEAKRNKWERKHQLSLTPTIDLEDSGAGLNVAIKF